MSPQENRVSLGKASEVFSDALHTSFMDPLAGIPQSPADAGELLHLRVEYETLVRLPSSGWSLFTVHTYLDPLSSLPPTVAASLAKSIRSSTEGQLLYKSLQDQELRGLVEEFLRGRALEGGLDPEEGGETRQKGCPVMHQRR